MKRTSLYIFLFAGLLGLILNGCDNNKYKDVSRGNLEVFCDESLIWVVTETADSFMALYPEAKIIVTPVSAREGIVKILNQESRIFVSTRNLNDEEKQVKKANGIESKTIKYVFDGVACIAGSSFPAENISFDSLKNFLNGKNDKFAVYIPEKNSGVNEFVRNAFSLYGDSLKATVVQHESDVIAAVMKNGNSIGLIGINSYRQNAHTRLLRIGSVKQNGVKNVYFEPHPGFYVQKLYPLTRDCVIILSEIKLGLASGFASFLSANEGQRIALKHGLGPATVPVRLVN